MASLTTATDPEDILGVGPDHEHLGLEISPDELLFPNGVPATAEQPRLTTKEVATIFFARSPHWLRALERMWPKGQGPARVGRTEAGARAYTLADIEAIAHAAAQAGRIDMKRLRAIIAALASVAAIWGIPTTVTWTPPIETEEPTDDDGE